MGAAQTLNYNEKAWLLFASLQLNKLMLLEKSESLHVYAFTQQWLTDILMGAKSFLLVIISIKELHQTCNWYNKSNCYF